VYVPGRRPGALAAAAGAVGPAGGVQEEGWWWSSRLGPGGWRSGKFCYLRGFLFNRAVPHAAMDAAAAAVPAGRAALAAYRCETARGARRRQRVIGQSRRAQCACGRHPSRAKRCHQRCH
jgi:hypothetical protein